MKILALIPSVAWLALASCSSPAPVGGPVGGPVTSPTDSPVGTPRGSLAENTALSPALSALGSPGSAHTAAIACLKAVHGAAGSTEFAVHSLKSELVQAVDGTLPRIEVTMDIAFADTDPGKSDAALAAARSALAGIVESGGAAASYDDAKEAFIRGSALPRSEGASAARQRNERRETLRAVLPAHWNESSPAAGRPQSGDSDDQNVALYVRSIAMSDRVQMPVRIDSARTEAGGRKSYRVEPAPTSKTGAGVIKRAQIANFLYLVEKNSKLLSISSLEFREPHEDGFRFFEAEVSAPDKNG